MEVKRNTMFVPKTEKIEKLAKIFPARIKEVEGLFDKSTIIYIDYANVFYWSKKLKWNIDIRRLKQFLNSFDTIKQTRLYNGTLKGDKNSAQFIKEAKKLKYTVTTKPVKVMRLSIDASSIPSNSPAILSNFIDKALLKHFDLKTIESLNNVLKDLNSKGIRWIEHRKCNFDVEIGRDMFLDFERNGIENFILWSGDSDFADPVSQLLKDKKKVSIFATARRISVELANTKAPIFDIQKIRNFICKNSQIQDEVKNKI